MTLPLNRIVAFAGPYLSVVAGGIASWLVAKVNIAGLPGLDENNLKTSIAGGLAWLLVAGLTWAGHSKWLAGHHVQMQADAHLDAAALTAASAAPAQPQPAAELEPAVAHSNGNGFHADEIAEVPDPYVIEDPYSETMGDEDAVSDDEELAAPPPPINYAPGSDLELVS
jgi:hypothetical protein